MPSWLFYAGLPAWLALFATLLAAHSAAAQAGNGRFELIPSDTLFYVDNRGADRVFVELNGHAFKLVADAEEARNGQNAFLIPANGDLTINVASFLRPADNYVALSVQGPPGADAEFIIANVLQVGQQVAYEILVSDLRPLPTRFALLQSYPNPFREQATLVYDIPENRATGLDVQLVVYDVLGRRVRTLVDGRRFPGRFKVAWDGTDAAGHPVPPGLYLCRLTADAVRETIRLIRVR